MTYSFSADMYENVCSGSYIFFFFKETTEAVSNGCLLMQ